MTEITEQSYDKAFEVLPPMLLVKIDGAKVSGGFAVSEAIRDFDNNPTFQGYWKAGDKFYTAEVSIMNADGKNIGWYYEDCAWTKLYAKTIK